MAIYKNISASGTTHTTLIGKNKGSKGNINKVSISNTSSTIEPIIILFINDGTNTYTFIRTSIPVGATLLLDDLLAFDVSKYDLKITTYHASGTVDISVIIK